MAGTVILITWEQQLSAWLFCKLRLLCKNSLLILKTYKTFLKEIFMRSKYIQRHSHSCLEDSIVKSWWVQLVLSFEVKKCESSTLFFFFLKKKKKKAIPHLPWVTGYSPPTHRHSTEEARRWLSPTDPPSFPESQCPRGTLLLSFFKSSQVAPSGACGGAAWTEAAALASAAGSGRQARVCTSLRRGFDFAKRWNRWLIWWKRCRKKHADEMYFRFYKS